MILVIFTMHCLKSMHYALRNLLIYSIRLKSYYVDCCFKTYATARCKRDRKSKKEVVKAKKIICQIIINQICKQFQLNLLYLNTRGMRPLFQKNMLSYFMKILLYKIYLIKKTQMIYKEYHTCFKHGYFFNWPLQFMTIFIVHFRWN